jgi:tRNA modification GTPase
VEAIGVGRASKLVESADILVWLGQPENAPDHPGLIRVHAKADLEALGNAPQGSLPVSSVSGEGIPDLLRMIEAKARQILPAEGAVALNRRQAAGVEEAAAALTRAATASDLVLLAEDLRASRLAFDRLTGKAGVEDVLDALFSRFCLGK